MDKKQSPRQILTPSKNGLCRLGIYVNYASGNLFYSNYRDECDNSTNRIKAKKAWIDDDGLVCVEVERRKQ